MATVRVDTCQGVIPKYNTSTDPYLQNIWVNLSSSSSDYATDVPLLNIFITAEEGEGYSVVFMHRQTLMNTMTFSMFQTSFIIWW